MFGFRFVYYYKILNKWQSLISSVTSVYVVLCAVYGRYVGLLWTRNGLWNQSCNISILKLFSIHNGLILFIPLITDWNNIHFYSDNLALPLVSTDFYFLCKMNRMKHAYDQQSNLYQQRDIFFLFLTCNYCEHFTLILNEKSLKNQSR